MNPSLCNLHKPTCSHWYKHVFSILWVPMGRSFAWPRTCSEATYLGFGTNFCSRDKTSLNPVSDIPFLAFISRSKISASNFVTVEPLYSGVFACFLMSSNFFWFFHQGNLASQHQSSSLEHLPLHYMPNSHSLGRRRFLRHLYSWSLGPSRSHSCALFRLHFYPCFDSVYPLKLIRLVGSWLLTHVLSKPYSLAWIPFKTYDPSSAPCYPTA